MDRHTWKAVETWWSKILGGKRVPVTGRTRGHAPDVAHPDFAVEVKAGAVLSTRLQTALEQAEASVIMDTQIPIVCITHSSGRGRDRLNTVMLRAEDFLALAKSAGRKVGEE